MFKLFAVSQAQGLDLMICGGVYYKLIPALGGGKHIGSGVYPHVTDSSALREISVWTAGEDPGGTIFWHESIMSHWYLMPKPAFISHHE